MTEKRYVYADPLAAAWMAKHFGMQFDSYPSNFHFTPESAPLSFSPSQYIVHPDSLHLLEPQPDDIVLVNDGEGANHLTWWRDGMDAKAVIAILRRDGVPFIRPERGEGREVRMEIDDEAVAAGADALQLDYARAFRLRQDAEDAARGVLAAALAIRKGARRRPAHLWTREEDLRLLAWRAEGKTYAEIAALTGLTESQLACRKNVLYSEPGNEAYRNELEQSLAQTRGERIR